MKKVSAPVSDAVLPPSLSSQPQEETSTDEVQKRDDGDDVANAIVGVKPKRARRTTGTTSVKQDKQSA